MSNIISINGNKPEVPEEESFYIKVVYTDSSFETFKAQAFGDSSELEGFIIIYDVEPYKLHCLVYKQSIRKMEIFSQKEIDEFNKKIEDDFIEEYMRDSFGNIEGPEV